MRWTGHEGPDYYGLVMVYDGESGKPREKQSGLGPAPVPLGTTAGGRCRRPSR
jgi:hypothetical protein